MSDGAAPASLPPPHPDAASFLLRHRRAHAEPVQPRLEEEEGGSFLQRHHSSPSSAPSAVDMPPLELEMAGKRDLRETPTREELQLSCCTGRSSERWATVAFHAVHVVAVLVLVAATLLLDAEGEDEYSRYPLFGAFVAGVLYVAVATEVALTRVSRSSLIDRAAPWPVVLFAKSLAVSSANLGTAAAVFFAWPALLPDGDGWGWQLWRDAVEIWLFVALTNVVRRWLAARAVFQFNIDAHLARVTRLGLRARLINDLCERDAPAAEADGLADDEGRDVSAGRFARALKRLRRGVRARRTGTQQRYELRLAKKLSGGRSATAQVYEVGAPPPREAIRAILKAGTRDHIPEAVLEEARKQQLKEEEEREKERERGQRERKEAATAAADDDDDESKDDSATAAATAAAAMPTTPARRGRSLSDGAREERVRARAAQIHKQEREQRVSDLSLEGHIRRTADLIMARLDPSRRGWFLLADLEEVYTKRVAAMAFEFFEVVPDGRVGREAVVATLRRFFDERRRLRQHVASFAQLTPAIRSFFSAVHGAVVAVAAPVLMGFELERTLLLVGTLLVSVSFAIGQSLRNVFDSYVFLVYVRPFAIGDRIELVGDPSHMKYWVDSATLLSTTLRSWNNKVLVMPNHVLAASGIHNLTRSRNGELEVLVDLPFDTPVSLLKRLGAAVLEHTRRNRAAWVPIVDLYIVDLDRTRGVRLSVWLISALPLSMSRELLINLTAVRNVVRFFLKTNGVKWVDSELPVRVAGGVGGEGRADGGGGRGMRLGSTLFRG